MREPRSQQGDVMSNSPSYADVIDPGLSDVEARQLAHHACQQKLDEFVSAMAMQKPVSNDKAATLIRHIVKNGIAADPLLVAGQMRINHWEGGLANGDNLDVLAERACAFLAMSQGRYLLAFFSRVFSDIEEKAV
jgi:hypothetical protein